MISQKTAKEIILTINSWAEKHKINKEEIFELINELQKIEGSKSFVDSINILNIKSKI